MLAENIFIGAVALTVLIAIAGFFLVIVVMRKRDTQSAYPFDDPRFVHIGMTPAQQNVVSKIPTINLAAYPFNRNLMDDAVYYAMRHDQFLKFHAELMKYTREKIAEAAKAQEAFLRGDSMILSEFVIGLAPIKETVAPGASAAESEQIMRSGNLASDPAL